MKNVSDKTVRMADSDPAFLEPRQEISASVDVTKAYQVSQPGTYYIRVTPRGVWTERDEENRAFAEIAYSNPVQVTIGTEPR